MPAFSATDAYKEAAGFPREFGAYNFEQFKQALDRAQRANSKGDWLTEFVTEYLLNNQDAPSPEEVAAMGDRIVPGLGAALAKRQQNLQQISDSFGDVRGQTGNTMSTVLDNLNGQAGDISRTGDISGDILNDWYARNLPRAEDTNNRVISQMLDSYGKAGTGMNETFGSLRGQNAQAGKDLLGATNEFYDRSRGLSSRTTRDLIDSAGEMFDRTGRERNQTFDRLQDNADRTIGGLTGEARDEYGNMVDESGSKYSELGKDTDSTYGQLSRNSADAIRALQGDTTGTYGRLEDSSGKSFDESMAETELLKPAGEAQQARVARSYAPVVANAKQRLRASGVDENDAQAISQLAEVEAKRAALMDDAAASSTGDYVGRRADIRAAKQAGAERLGTRRLDTSIDLGKTGLDQEQRLATSRLNTTIGLGERGLANNQRLRESLLDSVQRLGLAHLMNGQDLDLSRLDQNQQAALNRELNKQGLSLNDVNRQIQMNENELARGTDVVKGQLDREIALGSGQTDRNTKLEQDLQDRYARQEDTNLKNLQGIDSQKASADIGLADTQYARTQDWRDKGNAAAQLQRAMEQQDWATAANILNQDSQEQLTALDLRNMAYTKGNQYITDQFNRKNSMMANLQGIGAQQYARSDANYNQANRAGTAAQGAYQQTAQQEAGKGGWGTRLLGAAAGIAAPFASMIPGVGQILGPALGAVGGVMGGNTGGMAGGGGGWPQGGGYPGGSTNPYYVPWQKPPKQADKNSRLNSDDLFAGG